MRSRIPREIWVLIVAAFVIALGYGLIAPVLPQFARSFDVSVTAASSLVSAFAFFRLAFAPAAGSLVERLGGRRVYVSGLLIVAVSTGACAFAQSYGQLLAFRSLGGIGSTMFTVSAMGLIVRHAPPDIRGRVSSAYGGAFLLGNVAGPVLGALTAAWGMRVPFGVYAVALMIAAAVVALNMPKPVLEPAGKPEPVLGTAGPDDAAGQEAPVEKQPAATQQPPMTLGEALRDIAYRTTLTSGFANGWATFGIRVSLVPLLAAFAFPEHPWTAGGALAVFALGNAVALTQAGRLADTVGRKPLMVTGQLVSGVFTAALGFIDNLPLFLALCVLAGAGSGLFAPAMQAMVADVIGNERSAGKVLATSQMVQDVGAIVGPVLGGVLADRFGYGTAFAVTGAILLGAALLATRTRETLPGHREKVA